MLDLNIKYDSTFKFYIAIPHPVNGQFYNSPYQAVQGTNESRQTLFWPFFSRDFKTKKCYDCCVLPVHNSTTPEKAAVPLVNDFCTLKAKPY